MSVANRIFTNTMWQVGSKVMIIFIGAGNLALITRILGQTNFGFYTTIFAFVQMFMMLTDFGLYLAMLREVSTVKSKEEESKVINNIFTIRLLASILVLLLIPLVIKLFPYDQVVKDGVVFFVLVFFFQSLISTLTAVFSKKMDMSKVAIVNFFNKAAHLLFLIYLFKVGGTLNSVLITQSVVFAIGFLIFVIFLRKYIKLVLHFDFKYWKHVIVTTWPLAAGTVLNLLYFKADTLILSAYHSPADVGLYGAPYKALEVLTTFPHMFMSLMLPLLTAAWLSKNLEKLKSLWQNSFDFFSMIVIGMIVGTWLISKPVMILLAGSEFAASGPILNVLVLATAAIFFGVLFTYMVVALNVQRQMVKYFFTAAVIALIGYFIFIPRFSYWGAAYMTLGVEVLIVFFGYLVVRKNIDMKLNYKVLGKSLLVGILTLAIVWPWKDYNFILTAIVAGSLYLGGLYLTKAFTKETIKLIFKRQV